jgi:hypothetical protein
MLDELAAARAAGRFEPHNGMNIDMLPRLPLKTWFEEVTQSQFHKLGTGLNY